MTPLFSLRSLLSIFIGLILGTVGGIGYNSVSSGTAELKAAWPPIHLIQTPASMIYETSIQGRILHGINDDTFIRNMDAEGQYYTAMMNSLTYFQYFSEIANQQNPQYALTPEKLSQMVTIAYTTLANNPSVIVIKVSCSDSQEAFFLAQNLPAVFEHYLADQQNSLQAEVYQNKLKQIDVTRQSLLKAGQDLVDSTVHDTESTIPNSQQYIDLSAKVTSLQDELNTEARQAADLLSKGITPAPNASPTTSPSPTPVTSEYGTYYVLPTPQDNSPGVLDARIKELEQALQEKEWIAAGFTPANGSSSLSLPDISVLSKAYQEASDQLYTNTIAAMERTSTELSKAKVNMAKLQAQMNQQKIAQDNADAPMKLANTLAAAQIASLTSKLDALTTDLQSSSPTVPPSQLPKFFITAAPQAPLPLTPSKNIPVLGALAGMFCGWLFINRRWLAGHAAVDEEENEEPVHRYSSADVKVEPENHDGQEEDKDWLNKGIYQPLKGPDPRDNSWLIAGLNPEPSEPNKVTSKISSIPSKEKENEDPKNIQIDQLPEVCKNKDSEDWFSGNLNIDPEGNPVKEDEAE